MNEGVGWMVSGVLGGGVEQKEVIQYLIVIPFTKENSMNIGEALVKDCEKEKEKITIAKFHFSLIFSQI